MNAATKASILGQFSFEGDSIPDFSEFDSSSVINEYINERYEKLACLIFFENCVCPLWVCFDATGTAFICLPLDK